MAEPAAGSGLRSLAWLALGRVALMLCSVLSIRLTTSTLGVAEMGVMNLVLTTVSLFALVLGAFSLFFYRQVVEWQVRGLLAVNICRYAWFVGAAALVAVAVMALAYRFQGNPWQLVEPTAMAGVLAGNIVLVTLNGALLYCLNASGRRGQYALLSNVASWGGLGAALLLTGQRGPSALLWLTGLLCGQALSLAAAAGLLAGPLGHPAQLEKARAVQAAPVDDFRLRSVWAFSWPLVICTALYWVQRSSFGPWLAATGGVHELGLFSVAFSVGLLTMAAADTVFTEYYSPLFYRRLAQGGEALRVESWNAYAHALLPALVIMFVCIAANGLPLLQLLVPGEFQGLPMVAACGAVSQLLISAYSLQMLLASSFMDNRLLILPNAVGAAVTVALMTLLVPELPVAGAALAVMAGLLVTNGGIAASLHQRYANRWPVRRMAGAAGAALPMFGVAPGLDAALPLWPPDGRAALALALCAAYAAALQYGLARPWWRLTGAAA